jgi:predicted PurR-regulated permease PerM
MTTRVQLSEALGLTGGKPVDEPAVMSLALRLVIRIGVVVFLLGWCFSIVRPFLGILIWAIIIAVAAYQPFASLQRLCGDRGRVAAAIFVALGLGLILLPTYLLADTLFAGVRALAADLADGALTVPGPPASVAGWPMIGEPLHRLWALASSNLHEALAELGPQLTAIGQWTLGFARNLTLGMLQFVIAIFIAAAMLANAASGEQLAGRVATGLGGATGPRYTTLAVQTIRSVTKGILGVALIQSTAAGLGFLAIGLPAAGLLAFVCLILAIVQIGPALVLIPAVIYGFTAFPTTTAVMFAIWCGFVGVLDNILKPILLGRGVALPMSVIFIGAIGGFLAYGILGLFVGPVVLALGYTAISAWLADIRDAPATTDSPAAVQRP